MKRFALHRFFGYREGLLESWIASGAPAEHALADEALRQMGEEKALLFLLATIEVEERRRRRRGWCNAALIWVGSFVAMFVLIAYARFRHHMVLMTLQNTAMFCGFIALLLGGTPSRLHRECVERLAALDDRRVFPALVAALVNPYKIAGDIVTRRLTRMLPKLETEDFAALPQDHQRRFFLFINPKFSYNKNTDMSARREFARALLLTVSRLGNCDAIPATKRLANTKSKTGEDDTLQRTAQNCLPFLEKARADQKSAEQRMVVRR